MTSKYNYIATAPDGKKISQGSNNPNYAFMTIAFIEKDHTGNKLETPRWGQIYISTRRELAEKKAAYWRGVSHGSNTMVIPVEKFDMRTGKPLPPAAPPAPAEAKPDDPMAWHDPDKRPGDIIGSDEDYPEINADTCPRCWGRGGLRSHPGAFDRRGFETHKCPVCKGSGTTTPDPEPPQPAAAPPAPDESPDPTDELIEALLEGVIPLYPEDGEKLLERVAELTSALESERKFHEQAKERIAVLEKYVDTLERAHEKALAIEAQVAALTGELKATKAELLVTKTVRDIWQAAVEEARPHLSNLHHSADLWFAIKALDDAKYKIRDMADEPEDEDTPPPVAAAEASGDGYPVKGLTPAARVIVAERKVQEMSDELKFVQHEWFVSGDKAEGELWDATIVATNNRNAAYAELDNAEHALLAELMDAALRADADSDGDTASLISGQW